MEFSPSLWKHLLENIRTKVDPGKLQKLPWELQRNRRRSKNYPGKLQKSPQELKKSPWRVQKSPQELQKWSQEAPKVTSGAPKATLGAKVRFGTFSETCQEGCEWPWGAFGELLGELWGALGDLPGP